VEAAEQVPLLQVLAPLAVVHFFLGLAEDLGELPGIMVALEDLRAVRQLLYLAVAALAEHHLDLERQGPQVLALRVVAAAVEVQVQRRAAVALVVREVSPVEAEAAAEGAHLLALLVAQVRQAVSLFMRGEEET